MNPKRRAQLERAYVELLWRHYAHNPEDFFRDCIKIPAGEMYGGTTGRTPFELFDYQKDTLRLIRDNRYVVVLKARQLGLTTLMMAYAFWTLMFRPGSNVVLVSRSQGAANSALEMIDFMYNFLPDWVKDRGPKLESDAATHHSYRFKDGLNSKITSYAATRTVAAGQTASLVLWDEAALAEYQDDALRTLLPTTDAGGSMVVFSTARGGYNAFAQLFKAAERKESQFVPAFHPWHASRFMNPLAEQGEIDFTHYEAKKRDLAGEPWRFYAEYPSSSEEAFRQSGRSRFPNLPEMSEFNDFPLKGELTPGSMGTIMFREDPDGFLYARPEALDGTPDGCRTVIAVDPSSGTGGDYTVITAGWVDRDGVPQRVAYWRSNMTEPTEYARVAYLMGEHFKESNGRNALIVVERQGGYGETIIHALRGMGYSNLYVHKYTGHRKYRQDTSYGFPMTHSRRPLVVDSLAEWLNFESGQVMGGVDKALRRELGSFVVRENGSVSADSGEYDDLVMSTAIWVYVALENLPKATKDSISEEMKQAFDVSHIWSEAQQLWREQDRLHRRERRQLAWR